MMTFEKLDLNAHFVFLPLDPSQPATVYQKRSSCSAMPRVGQERLARRNDEVQEVKI